MSAPSLDEQIRSHLETLEVAPGDLAAFRALEALYEGESRWEDLIALYEGRARVAPEPGAPLLAKAARLAHAKLRNVARAEELYAQMLRVDPAHPAALRAVVELLEERGDFAGAAEALDRLAMATAQPVEAARLTERLGRLQEEKLGRRDRAALQYARAYRLDPSLAAARGRAIACFVALRRFGQAKRLLDAARDAGAERGPLAAEYTQLGARLVDEPLEHALATECLIEALALDRGAPGAAAARERLAGYPRAWREEARALEGRAASAGERRAAADAHLQLAEVHLAYDAEGGPRALEQADRAWALAPGEPRVLEILSRVHGDRGDHPAHADHLARLAEGTRDRAALVALHLELARVDLLRFGDAETALVALGRALDLDPACESAALQAFEHHVDAGRVAEALAVLERHLAAAQAKPAHAPLRVRAAELARDRLGDAARARRHLEAALRADPGHTPAAAALAPLLADAGEWPALAQVLERWQADEPGLAERIRLLERLAEVQQERLARPREALGTLARALALDPSRAATRKAMEGAAARADAFAELARAYRSAVEAVDGDLKARKALLRRVAEIHDRDLGKPEEAVRAWRALVQLDPADRGATAALDACLARAGQVEELARAIDERRGGARGEERRALSAKLARVLADAGQPERAASAWRDALADGPEDDEALWGLHAALEALPGTRAAEERVEVLARLAARAKGPAERGALALARAEALLEPLGRIGDAARAAVELLEGGGLAPAQRAEAVALLERLLAKGAEPLPVARTLAHAYASGGDAARQAEALERLARALPDDARAERARHLLETASLRERLGDARGALSAAAAALRASPDHADALARCEALARGVGAHRELLELLAETADALAGRPDEEHALRLRAAAVAEEDLGATDAAALQLRRALALRPGDPATLAALTRAALAGERWVEAGELLAERGARAAGAEKAALLAQRAEVLHERLGDAAGAVAALREAVAAVPGEGRARLLVRLARALGDAGDFAAQASALAELSDAATDPAEAARAALESARLHEGMGDAAGAVARLAAALAARPDDPAALAAIEGHLDGADAEAARAAARALAASPDPRRRARALEAEARLAEDPEARADALRAAARIQEAELHQASLAFLALADAVRATPADAPLRAELRRVAELAQEIDACARLHDALAEAAPAPQRAAILRERAELVERRGDPAAAADAWARLLAAAPDDPGALAAVRRLHRGAERWAELADACAAVAHRAGDAAARAEARREEAAVAEARLGDLARAAAAWEEVLAAAPGDAEAQDALERLYDRLDRPEALAGALSRRLDAGFDLELAARLAELRRARLGDAAGALALHLELLQRDPGRVASRDALVSLAGAPGEAGRAALAAAERVLAAAGAHASRIAAREARLAAVEDPAERAPLLAEIRAILEVDLREPAMAFVAACRAFAEGGLAREGADRDLERLGRVTGNEDALCEVWEEAAADASPGEGLPLRRRAARLRTEAGGGAAAVAAWRAVLDAAPDDAEALSALEQLFAASRSAGELLEVARRRAALAAGPERIEILLHAARAAEELGDADAARDGLRAARAEGAGVAALEGLVRLLARAGRGPEWEDAIGALADAVRADPARRTTLLLERARALEDDADPRRPIEAYAELLAERPREADAVAGLERLLARADAREAAARALEDVHRAAGDARRLAALLEVRLETGDAAERAPLLAEVAALHERLGDRGRAFAAKLREVEDALRAGRDAPGARAELERLAGAAGGWEDVARVLEGALEGGGLPPDAALAIRRRLAVVAAERLGRLDLAARCLEDVASAAPSAEALGALARVHRRMGAPRELARTLERLADVAPVASRKELLLEVAKIMADQLSDREGAVTAYRKLLAVDPEDPNALRLLGGLLGAAERWDELADVLSREVAVADRQPNFVAEAAELRYRLGQIRHQRLSDPAAALACYREVLAKVPRHPAALGALEELAGGSGPAAVDAAMLLEPIYAAEGEHQKLVEVLEARAANQPDPAERAALLRRIAEVYGTSLKNAEMAFLAAGRAVAANPDAPESLALSVKYAQAAGLVEELASLLAEHADRVHDPRARVEFQRRLAGFAAAGDPARAAEAWQRVLDLEPTDRDAMLGLVDALRAGGDAEAFAQAIRRALAAEGAPEVRAGLLAELAAVQEDRLGDLAGAIISLKRLLDLLPGDRDALARLDELSVKTERWVDLADVLPREIAAAHAAGDAAALLALRQRLAELKETRLLDREGALALYEEVLQARPDHPEAVARLEAMLQKDPANARAATLLEASYAKGGDAAKQAAVLEVRAGERPDPLERKALYLELAALREQKLGDPQLAFLALCKAFREDPADAALRARLEALAEASDHHEELAAIYEDELDRLAPQDTARVALRLGALYEERLGEPQRAVEFLRRAVALDPEVAQAALTALERIHGRLEAWPELADALGQRALVVAGPERVQLLFRLGQLCEERLAEPDRAAQAYEDAVQSDPRHVPSLRALEVLYEGAGRQEDLFRNLAAQRVAPGDAAEKERVLAKMAVLATELGRLEEAVALWKELLAAKPRHDGALVALEDLYEQLERWQDLAQHLRLRVSATVDRREIARLNDKLGLVLGAKLGDLGQAVQSYRAVLDSDPRNRRALEALREIYATQGDQEALAGVYRRLVPLQEDARGVKRVRIELAEVLLRAGSKREAIEQARLAFDIEPHAAEELVRIEEVFRGAGAGADGVRAAEARAALLAEQGPAEAVPAWLAVADLWKGEKRPEQAAAAFEKVLELDPPNRTAYEGLRGIYAAANNWRAFARVCDLFAPNVVDPSEKIQLLTEVATVHEKRLGQKEMAFLSWCRALAEAPADGDALAAAERLAAETEAFDELAAVLEQVSEEARGTVRARLLLRLGKAKDERLDDMEGAESAFRKALEADPASPEALEALTQLFKRRGRVRDLVITLEQKLEAAAGLDEKKATLLEVARIYDGELHDVDEAVGALRRVLELDGADPAALDALSAVLRREARWADLAQILSRARDLAPDDTQRIAFQLQIAALYEKEIGDDEASVEAYRTVLGLDDRNADALAGLERLYTKLDRFAELNRVYERQIALAEDARERVRILAKSAGIHEEKLNDPRAAIEKNEAILRVDGGNLPSIKALERLYRDEALWDRLISVLQHHLTLVSERREQVALEVAIGEVFYEEMSRVDRAEAIFNHALQLDPESREAVSALGRLYERSGNWNLALDMLKREARIAGGAKDAVDLHVRMGAIHEDMLMDVRSAKEAYARALQLEPGCLPAIRAVKGIAERERDRDRFLEMLVEEARYAQDGAEKTRLYTEAARVYHEERDDKESAARYYEEALKRAPGHPDAARPLADLYVSAQRWPDAERVLDAVVEALAAEGDAKELCRQAYRQGYVAEKLGKGDKALAAYRRAYELDATYLPALEGLGNLLVQAEQWEEALRIFTAIIIHHRDDLTDLEVVETHCQIGEISEKLGQLDRAAPAFRKALEIDANHERSRRCLVRVLEVTGDWEGAVENRQRLLPILEGQAKLENLVAIGEACRDKLQDPYQAIDAFLAASRLDPTALPVTEALLGLYKETRQGQKAADVLQQMLALPDVQADAARAASLHASLAQILLEDVKDDSAAVAELEKALDRNPRLVQAFAKVEEILSGQKRWSELESAYIRMIQRLPKTADAAKARVGLWRTLGDLYRDVLRNEDGARTAYGVVAKADPEDAAAVEQWADLAAKKPGEEGEAIAAYRQLVRTGAKAQKAASALITLHAARKEYDKAYSAAQVLANLVGGATPDEVQVAGRLRKFARDQAARPLDDALWALLLHERVKGPLADILTLLALHARPMFLQKEKDLGLTPKKDELDVRGSMLFFANMFKYVERTLGLEGKLRLFRKDDVPQRLQLVPTDPVALIASEDMFRERPKKELWFAIAKAMAFARPELLLARLMPHDQLDLVFQAACSVGTSRFVVTADPHLVEKLKRELERTLPENVRKNTLKVLARSYCELQHAGDVRAYLDGAELTSNRVATLVAGDLDVVRRAVVAEKAQVSKLRDETRLHDLATFCVSEEYARLRDRLGLSCVVPG